MIKEQIKRRLDKLSTTEIKDNLVADLYEPNEKIIALAILKERKDEELVAYSQKDRKKATYSMWAAWIAAIASVISIIISLLTFLKP